MYTWKQVESMLNGWKQQALSVPDIVVKLANACIGWSYVFGGRGQECTPANRKSAYREAYPTIKSKCQVIRDANPVDTCVGCKWYPGGKTLFYDCRGFTYWLFLKAGNIKINGAGATSQYNDDSNWSEKGPIENMPKNKVCCVFRHDSKTNKMEHTLLYDGNGNYIHCSGEVKKCDISKYNATHYAIPKGLYNGGDEPMPTPTPTPDKGYAIVTGKNVALREGPSTNCRVIKRIPTGMQVKIESSPDDWEYVSHDGKTGFMMKKFLKKG